MRRSTRGKVVYAVGMVLVAVPFAFALLRASSTGTDFRFVWVALATFAVAALVTKLGRARGTSLQGIFFLFVAAVVIGASLGRLVAGLLGAQSEGAMWFVAAGFALCQAAGYALVSLSRTRAMGAEWRAVGSPGR